MFKQYRVVVLFLTFSALLTLTLVMLPRDPVVALRIGTWYHKNTVPTRESLDMEALERQDPVLGSLIPNNSLGKQLAQLSTKARTGLVVVFLQDCISCVSFDRIDWGRAAQREGFALALVVGGEEQDMEQYRPGTPQNIVLMHDPGNQAHRQFNAYFSGRVYYYNPRGELVWLAKRLHTTTVYGQVTDLHRALEREKAYAR
jgi:hypothetical protein